MHYALPKIYWSLNRCKCNLIQEKCAQFGIIVMLHLVFTDHAQNNFRNSRSKLVIKSNRINKKRKQYHLSYYLQIIGN